MASTISEHVQEMSWSFAVREIFHPRSQDNVAIVVLAGNVLSGSQDDPIGRPVRVFVNGIESGQGTVLSRYRFDMPLSDQSAYVYEGSPIDRKDIDKDVVLALNQG